MISLRALTLGALCVLIASCASPLPHSADAPLPQPAETLPGSVGKGVSKQRRAYIESLHRAAPDVDWREIDGRHMELTLKQRMLERADAVAAGKSQAELRQVKLGDKLSGVWSERGSVNQAGRTIGGAYDAASDRLWVYSHGGNIWRAQRQALDWTLASDGASFVPSFIHGFFDRLEGSAPRLLVGAQRPGGLWFSDDDGASWTQSAGLPSGQILDLQIRDAASSNEVFVLARSATIPRLYRSSNRGSTFQDLGAIAPACNGNRILAGCDVALHSPRYGSTEVYLLVGTQVSRFNDGTGQFQPVATLPGSVPASGDRVVWSLTGGRTAQGQNFLYALRSDQIQGATRVWRSLDGGSIWSERTPAPTGFFEFSSNGVASSTRDPERLLLAGVNAYRSGDGAQTWTLINDWPEYYANPAGRLHADVPAIAAYVDAQGGERFLLHTDGGTYESRDGGISVNNLSLNGLRVSQYYTSYTARNAPHQLLIGSQDQGFQKNTNPASSGQLSLNQVISGDYAHLSASSDNRVWSSAPGFVILETTPTVNNAAGLRYFRYPENRLTGALFLAPIKADPQDPNRALLAGGRISSGERVITLSYNGSSISGVESAFDFGSQITGLGFSEARQGRVYAITSANRVFRSENRGVSWTAAAEGLPSGQFFYGHAVLPDRVLENRVYIGGAGYSNPAVFRSDDAGATFQPFATGLPSTLVYDLAMSVDGQHLFAATEVGAYYFDQAQNRWTDITGLGGPAQIYWDVDFIDELQLARFSTYGRGIWDLKLADPNAPTDEPSLQRFSLPVPNPANANCPGGYFIAAVDDGPGAGISAGIFGMELLLDEPGTRRLEGGLNFGGLVDAGQAGFAGVNIDNPGNENQRLNVSLRGSPSADANGSLPVRIEIIRQTLVNGQVVNQTVFESNANLSLAQASTSSVVVPPGYYVATVTATGTTPGQVGGAPEGQFFFELSTSFVDRPGGGFQGGAVVGGYHAQHPFGGVSGFAAFCLGSTHSSSVRVLSQPSYGPTGARDLRLRILDGEQRVLVSVPGQ